MYTLSSLMRGVSGDDPEGGAGSGVPRLRLVTAFSEGSGPRPPGTTTWLRGARCTDREEMPVMEARPRPKIAKAERREARVPIARDAGRLASAPARERYSRASRCLASTGRLSALRSPRFGEHE